MVWCECGRTWVGVGCGRSALGVVWVWGVLVWVYLGWCGVWVVWFRCCGVSVGVLGLVWGVGGLLRVCGMLVGVVRVDGSGLWTVCFGSVVWMELGG